MPLKNLKTRNDLAVALNVPLKLLSFALYTISEDKKYTKFQIKKKSGGQRTISKPCPVLKKLQKRLLPLIEDEYEPKACSYGFEKNKNIKDNAEKHRCSKVLLNVDLHDFFGTINFGRIYGLFMSSPFNFGKEAAASTAKLVTHSNCLPQGACTSPILANMILRKFDARIMSLCKKSSSTYTRFADDITISTTKPSLDKSIIESFDKLPKKGVVLGDKLVKAIAEEGFKINENKTRIQTKDIRQEVTGLVINEFVNVRRKYIKSVFCMIYAWKKYGLAEASKYNFEHYKKCSSISNEDLFKLILQGRIGHVAYIRSWQDAVVVKLCKKYVECDPDAPAKIKETAILPTSYDIFIGHSSEQKNDIAIPIYDELKLLGVKAFIDIVEIKWGDSLTRIINKALGESKYFLAIISPDSISKAWPDKEMNAAIAREISGKQIVLPLFVGTKGQIEDMKTHYSLISDKLYYEWDGNAAKYAKLIHGILSS